MDVLTYVYGSTPSNKLLKVSDAGDKTKGFIEPTSTSGDDYAYDVNGNMTSDKNKDITSITYNHLNLPVQVTKDSNEYIKYIYNAAGQKLTQEVYNASNVLQKKTDYAGEFFYENDTLKFINHEEGRVVMTGAVKEYQYHLKDHLGNVRTTFTTLAETDNSTGTLEDANATAEQAKFLRYTNAKRIYATLLDRTNGSSAGYSERLNGSANEKYGLAKSLSVMPGDVLQLEVYAKYIDPNTSNWTGALSTLMGQVAANAGGIVVDGAGYSTSTTSFPSSMLGLQSTSNNGAPKAYLNWLIFDRNYGFITGGFKQITTAAKEAGSDVAHEHVVPTGGDILIKEPGYIYVFLSNEETSPVEVYFDDFKVTHVKSPVVQMDDYYPFGLTFNSHTRENSIPNQYQYNSKELQDELGLGWLDYGSRMFMPDIGRWGIIDPLSEKGRRWSPYNYAFNNPMRFIDPDGMWPDLPSWSDVGNFANGVVNAIASDNTTVMSVDGKTTLAQGFALKSGDEAFSAGQTTGHVIAAAQGIIEGVAGLLLEGGGAVGGTVTAPTIVGPVAGVAVVAAGVAVTAHGVSTAKTALNHLLNSDGKERQKSGSPLEKSQNQLEGLEKKQAVAKKEVKGEKQNKVNDTKKSEQNLKTDLKRIKTSDDVE